MHRSEGGMSHNIRPTATNNKVFFRSFVYSFAIVLGKPAPKIELTISSDRHARTDRSVSLNCVKRW